MSRQIQKVDKDAKKLLTAQFTEATAGLEHIRAFKSQKQAMTTVYRLLDRSQNAFYYTLAIERWLTLGSEFLSLALALSLMIVSINPTRTISPSGFGFSMFLTLKEADIFSEFASHYAALKETLRAVGRVRSFVGSTPAESPPEIPVEVPEDWPTEGEIIFENVTTQYEYDGPL